MDVTFQDRRFLEKHPLMVASLVVGMVFGLIIALIRPTFETNDDVLMIGVVTGHLGSSGPSEMLVMSHVWFGRVLSYLYAEIPSVPWYAICLLLTHFVAHVVFLWAFLLLVPKRTTIFAFLFYLVIIGVHLVCHFSYTTSAFLAAQSGLAILLVNLFVNLSRRPSIAMGNDRFRNGIGLLLIVVSCLLRWESCCLMLVSSIPLWCVVLWSDWTWREARRVLLIAFAMVAAVCVTMFIDHRAYRSDPEWDAYWKRHVDTCRVVDFGRPQALFKRPEESKDLLREVDWTPNDFWLLKSWFFLDAAVYPQSKIRLIGERWSRFQLSSFNENLTVFIGASLDILKHPVALMSLLVLVLSGTRKNGTLAAWSRRSVWLTASCGMIYLAFFKKLPHRVYVPILVFTAVQTVLLDLYFSRRAMESEPPVLLRQVWRVIGGTLLILVGGLSLKSDLQWNQVVLAQSRKFWNDVSELEKCRAKIIITYSVFPFDVITPYDDLRPLGGLRFFPMSFYQRSPHLRSLLDQLGIENLVEAMYTDPDVLFASTPELNHRVAQFLQEHYRVKVRFEPVLSGDSGFNLYRLRSVTGAVNSPIRVHQVESESKY